MQLLRQVTHALRESAVDDLHLAGYYGRLIDRLIQQPKSQPEAISEQPDNNENVLASLDAQNQDTAFATVIGRGNDWSDWLAFQFDPTLASIGEMGPDCRAFSPDNAGFGPAPG
jgi:hypothetical protein